MTLRPGVAGSNDGLLTPSRRADAGRGWRRRGAVAVVRMDATVASADLRDMSPSSSLMLLFENAKGVCDGELAMGVNAETSADEPIRTAVERRDDTFIVGVYWIVRRTLREVCQHGDIQ